MNINKKITIMWELSLKCNLNCSFCYQTERRNKQESEINFKQAIKIIDNIDTESHISFIGGESFLFPKFMEILKYLDKKWITYDITSNWTIIEHFIFELNKLKNLKHIIFSIDYFWEKHDISRSYKWLFNKIKNIIPKLNTQININTIIFEDTQEKEIIKLFLSFNKLNKSNYYLLINSSYTKEEYENSKNKIKNISIKKYSDVIINYYNLNKKAIKVYKKILKIKKILDLKTNIAMYPKYLLVNKNSCKHLENQIRINEYWNISVCHYINNNLW